MLGYFATIAGVVYRVISRAVKLSTITGHLRVSSDRTREEYTRILSFTWKRFRFVKITRCNDISVPTGMETFN